MSPLLKQKGVIVTFVISILTLSYKAVDAAGNVEFILQKLGVREDVARFLGSERAIDFLVAVSLLALVLSLWYYGSLIDRIPAVEHVGDAGKTLKNGDAINAGNVHSECGKSIQRLQEQADALTTENSELREFKERFRGKQQQLKDVQKELGGVHSELLELKERDKRHSWLRDMAQQQSREISHHVKLKTPYSYDARLTDSIPSIGFKFPIKNHSVIPVSVDKNIKGRIRFDGRELADPVIVKHCGQGLQHQQLDGLSIEQRLTRTEADHILATPLGMFDFQELEVTIKSGSDYLVSPQLLKITHEHAVLGITGQHPVLPA